MATHRLKTWPQPFQALWDGRKVHEYRRDDRGFRVGDYLHLMEYDPDTDQFSGRMVAAKISYISFALFGIPAGYCVMSLAELTRYPRDGEAQ